MKNFLLFLGIVLFLSVMSSTTREGYYYWSGGKKISLTIDKTSLLVKVKPGTDLPVLTSKIQNAGLSYFPSRVTKEEIIIKSDKDPLDINKVVSQFPEIENAAFGLLFQTDRIPMFINGEILIELKSGIPIDSVINFIGREGKSYEEEKYNSYKIVLKDWDEVIGIANLIYESGLVNYSHPNFKATINKFQAVPNDPLYQQQYYLNQGNNIDINAPQAWGISRGLRPVRVAVIDDGVENHEDIQGRVLPGFTPTNNNGFGAPTNPVPPANLLTIGHGQACAGIISATHNNLGVAGVAPCTNIIPINIFNDWFVFNQTVFFNENIENYRNAIDWAWDEGQAEVLSNSWGFTNQGANFDAITFAIGRARTQGRGDLGSIVVFASGNSHTRSGCSSCFSGVTFPANVNGVIAVGAIDRNGNIWNYSSRGPQMDLVAPSGNVGEAGDLVTTDRMGNLGYNNGNYTDTFGGTSAAAPQVSGVAALMLSVNAGLTETQVRTILQNTATDIGTAGFDNIFGFGRVNALAALQLAIPPITGTNLMCSSANFTFQNVPAGAMATWSVNPTSLFTGSTSGSGATANLNSSGSSGQATLTYSLTSPCGNLQVQRSFWVGTPQITNMRVNNMSYFTGMNVQLCPGNNWLNVTPVGGNPGNASWTVPSGIPHFVGTNTLDFTYPQNYSNSLTISVRASNACGQGANSNFFLSKKTFGCTSSFSVVIYPNPAKDQFSVEMMAIDKNAITEEVPVIESAVLLNKEGREIAIGTRVAGKMTFEVSNLQKGIYFIHVVVDGELTREQIIIE